MASYVFRRICLNERWAPFPFHKQGWGDRKRILNRRNYSKRKSGTGSVFNNKKSLEIFSLLCSQIRIVVGCRIWIRIRVYSRIQVRITVKIRIRIHSNVNKNPDPHQSLNSGAVAAQNGALEGRDAHNRGVEDQNRNIEGIKTNCRRLASL
jgi:hypothetical protein